MIYWSLTGLESDCSSSIWPELGCTDVDGGATWVGFRDVDGGATWVGFRDVDGGATWEGFRDVDGGATWMSVVAHSTSCLESIRHA